MTAEPFLIRARTAAETAAENHSSRLTQIATQENELLSVERSLNQSTDADEIERLTFRRGALRTALSRVREGVPGLAERAWQTKGELSNLESEAERLREQLGATEAEPSWVQTVNEYLKTRESETVGQLAKLTGYRESKVSAFVASYLRLEGHDLRRAAINEFFAAWLDKNRDLAGHPTPFDRLRYVLTELQTDRAQGKQRLTEHGRGIEIKLARLIRISGPIDIDALRRDYRERTLLVMLDADAIAEKHRGFAAALAEAEHDILEATQHRDKIQREMREDAETMQGYQKELERIRAERARGAALFSDVAQRAEIPGRARAGNSLKSVAA